MGTLIPGIYKHYKSKLLVFVFGIIFTEVMWLAGVIIVSASRSPQGVQALKAFSLCDYTSMQWLLLGPTIVFLASHIADVNQEGRMGRVLQAPGESPRQWFMIKLVLLIELGTLIGMIMPISAAFVRTQAGLLGSLSYVAVFWLIIALIIVSVFTISAMQLVLDNLFDDPPAGVVIDVVGTLITFLVGIALEVSMVGRLLPWGLLMADSSLETLTPGNSAGVDFVLASNPWLLVALAAAVVLAWVLVSARPIIRKEENA